MVKLTIAAVGPIVGGAIVASTTWRWMFWSTAAFQAVMTVASFLVFRETHLPTIQRKSNPNAERPRWTAVILRSLTRPLRLLVSHPIVQMQAVLSGFSYGVLYIVLSTFSELWIRQYHESTLTSAQIGRAHV